MSWMCNRISVEDSKSSVVPLWWWLLWLVGRRRSLWLIITGRPCYRQMLKVQIFRLEQTLISCILITRIVIIEIQKAPFLHPPFFFNRCDTGPRNDFGGQPFFALFSPMTLYHLVLRATHFVRGTGVTVCRCQLVMALRWWRSLWPIRRCHVHFVDNRGRCTRINFDGHSTKTGGQIFQHFFENQQ